MTEKERNAENSKPSSKTQKDLQPRPGNAAAWAWYQHAGGAATGGGNCITVRSGAPQVAVRRASRFREEAMRMSSSSIDDLISEADIYVDTVRESSLFDKYELVSVAKELDKALSTNTIPAYFHTSACESSSNAIRRIHKRIRTPPVLCSSMKIFAIKDKTEHLNHQAKSVIEDRHRTSSPLGRLSKAFQHFSLGTSSEHNNDEYQR